MAIIVKGSDTPEQKREAWADINYLSPDMAEFIKAISLEFGKLESVTVKAVRNA